MTQEKKPQCTTCKHNINTTSCSPCATKGSQMVENIGKELGVELNNTEEDEFHYFKQNCKIIMRYPEDYDKVNPFECQFYMPSFFSYR